MLGRLLILLLLVMIACSVVYAQKTVPLEKRNVSGILRDSLNKPIAGATVSLVSPKDTLQTATNEFGFYGFKDVRSAEFLLSIRALGYDAYNRKYFNNDTKAQLNIPPIRLGVKQEELDEVTIERLKGPVVKGDTTEFWAKDYIVRDYARLEDLLRRMEGITIDADGSVFYNGERVVKALFNNEQYFTGSVQEAMRELPADIVERIQIIDQNAQGTGAKVLKSDESVKVMNIVTKADKSAGKIYDLALEQGTQQRTKAEGSVRFIDGADQYGFNAGYVQAPVGVKSGMPPGSVTRGQRTIRISNEGGGSTGGQSQEVTAGFSFNQKIGTLHLAHTYAFTYNDDESAQESFSESFYEEGTLLTNRNRDQQAKKQDHKWVTNYRGQFKDQSSLTGTLSLSYDQTDDHTLRSEYRSGLLEGLEREDNTGKRRTPSYALTGEYRRKFSPRTELVSTFRSEYVYGNREESTLTEVFSTIGTAADSITRLDRDITERRSTNGALARLVWNKSDRLKMTWSLDPSNAYQLTDRRAFLPEGGVMVFQDSLSNYVANNTFRLPLGYALEYTFLKDFYVSPSIALQPNWLSGELNQSTAPISRFDAFVVPSLALGYTHRQLGNIRADYRLSYQQPSINQLNPNAYYTTVYDVVIGNPDIGNTRLQTYGLRYNMFFRKPMLNVSLMSNFMLRDRAVAMDRLLEFDTERGIVKNTTTYTNLDGGRQQMYHLGLTRTFGKINSTFKLNGSMNRSHTPYLSEGREEARDNTAQSADMSMFFALAKWVELTPELRYNGTADRNTLATAFMATTYNRSFYGNLNIRLFLPADLGMEISMSQALHRATNLLSNTSPFVLNANLEKRIFKQKNGIISVVVMDLARQNTFTGYASNEFGYTNTLTNPDSRYFLLQFAWRPQVWGKSRHDTGAGRRGDGSFVQP